MNIGNIENGIKKCSIERQSVRGLFTLQAQWLCFDLRSHDIGRPLDVAVSCRNQDVIGLPIGLILCV